MTFMIRSLWLNLNVPIKLIDSDVFFHYIVALNILTRSTTLLQYLQYFNFLNSQTFNIGISAKTWSANIVMQELKGKRRIESTRQLTYSVIVNIMDSTLVNENIQMKKKIEKFSEKMSKKTKFTVTEVEKLIHVYNKITVNFIQYYFFCNLFSIMH